MENSNDSKPVYKPEKEEYSIEAHQELKDNIASYNDIITQYEQPLTTKLLSFNPETKIFSLSKEAKVSIQNFKGRIVIISISGPPRIGKSTLLNFLITLILNEDQASRMQYQTKFKAQEGMNSITEGVDMFVVEKEGTNYVFLDVEGGDDSSKSDRQWYYQSILASAISISHVHIFFYNTVPGQSLMSKLKEIETLASKNDVRGEMKTSYIMLKNCDSSTLDEALKQCQDYFKGLSFLADFNYSAQVLSKPPNHICMKHDSNCNSCINKDSQLCKQCQESSYIKDLSEFLQGLFKTLDQSSAFNDADEILKISVKMSSVLERDVPYCSDSDNEMMIKLRNSHYRDYFNQTMNSLQNLSDSNFHNPLFQMLHLLPKGHSAFVLTQRAFEELNGHHVHIVTKVLQTEILIKSFDEFMKNELLNPKFPVYSEKEKETITETYVKHLLTVMKQLEQLLAHYINKTLSLEEVFRTARKEFEKSPVASDEMEDENAETEKAVSTFAEVHSNLQMFLRALLFPNIEIDVMEKMFLSSLNFLAPTAFKLTILIGQKILRCKKGKKAIENVMKVLKTDLICFYEELMNQLRTLIEVVNYDLNPLIDKKIAGQLIESEEAEPIQVAIESCQEKIAKMKTLMYNEELVGDNLDSR